MRLRVLKFKATKISWGTGSCQNAALFAAFFMGYVVGLGIQNAELQILFQAFGC